MWVSIYIHERYMYKHTHIAVSKWKLRSQINSNMEKYHEEVVDEGVFCTQDTNPLLFACLPLKSVDVIFFG